MVDVKILQNLVPINTLMPSDVYELAQRMQTKSVEAGAIVFKVGETDRLHYYVLGGQVELIGPDAKTIVKAGTEEARHPLDPAVPRSVTARALSAVDLVMVDRDYLDLLLTWDQTGRFEIIELTRDSAQPADTDWMTRLLQTKAFYRIPPEKIGETFARMSETSVPAGTVIIREGDEGDYYYIVKSGTCRVSRRSPATNENVFLADLNVGDSFGEEALVSERPRNATVTALGNVALMRLGKTDFVELLKRPLLVEVELDRAKSMVKDGAKLIDVRTPGEFKHGHIRGSVNIPLLVLRKTFGKLSPNARYVVVCDTGRRSAAATYLLNENGFDACLLSGGLQAAVNAKAAIAS
jgi:CRP-like cAMP-binding protein